MKSKVLLRLALLLSFSLNNYAYAMQAQSLPVERISPVPLFHLLASDGGQPIEIARAEHDLLSKIMASTTEHTINSSLSRASLLSLLRLINTWQALRLKYPNNREDLASELIEEIDKEDNTYISTGDYLYSFIRLLKTEHDLSGVIEAIDKRYFVAIENQPCSELVTGSSLIIAKKVVRFFPYLDALFMRGFKESTDKKFTTEIKTKTLVLLSNMLNAWYVEAQKKRQTFDQTCTVTNRLATMNFLFDTLHALNTTSVITHTSLYELLILAHEWHLTPLVKALMKLGIRAKGFEKFRDCLDPYLLATFFEASLSPATLYNSSCWINDKVDPEQPSFSFFNWFPKKREPDQKVVAFITDVDTTFIEYVKSNINNLATIEIIKYIERFGSKEQAKQLLELRNIIPRIFSNGTYTDSARQKALFALAKDRFTLNEFTVLCNIIKEYGEKKSSDEFHANMQQMLSYRNDGE